MKIEKLEQILKAGIVALAGSLIFSIFIAQAIAVLLLVLWLIKVIVYKKINLKNNPLQYPFLAFVIARIVSVFLSTDFSQSVQILNKEIFFYSLFFIVVDVFPIDDREYLKRFFVVLISAALIASLYGIGKVVFGFSDRASSTTSGYGTLGMFLTAVCALLLPIGSNKYFLSSKIIWVLILTVIITGILFTFNRIHWGIIGLIILAFGLMRERKAILVIILFAAVLIAAVPFLRERFYQLIFFTNNLSDRDILWQGAGMLYKEHPLFGFGPKSFTQIFPLFENLNDKGASSWHCDYLQIYMESGIFGLVPYLWLGVSVFYFGIRLLLNKTIDILYRDLTLAIILAMACFYLTAVVGIFILDPISSLLYQLLLGILAVNYRRFILRK